MRLFHSKSRQWVQDVAAIACSNAHASPDEWPLLLPALDRATDSYLRRKGMPRATDGVLSSLLDRPSPGFARTLGLMACAGRMTRPAFAELDHKCWDTLSAVVHTAPYDHGPAFTQAWGPVAALVATRQDADAAAELAALSVLKRTHGLLSTPASSIPGAIELILNTLLPAGPLAQTRCGKLLRAQLQRGVALSLDILPSTVVADALPEAAYIIEQVSRATQAGLIFPGVNRSWNVWSAFWRCATRLLRGQAWARCL